MPNCFITEVLKVREWKDLTKDEKEIINAMKMEGITPEDLISRMRNSGRMSEQAIEELRKALEEVRPFLVH
jgi:aminoglycoside phosphotransferase family enzyme